MRGFIQEFEHSTERMYEMLYGASDDPKSDPVIMGMLKRRNHNRNEERARNASTSQDGCLGDTSNKIGKESGTSERV